MYMILSQESDGSSRASPLVGEGGDSALSQTGVESVYSTPQAAAPSLPHR